MIIRSAIRVMTPSVMINGNDITAGVIRGQVVADTRREQPTALLCCTPVTLAYIAHATHTYAARHSMFNGLVLSLKSSHHAAELHDAPG